MKKYIFPLTKKLSMTPIALVTDNSLMYGENDGKFIFRDGKSCDVHIAYTFRRDPDIDHLDESIIMADFGNAVVTDGENWFQIAYKQTSRKE